MTLSPASSRGVPPTFECIRFPIAFDTPGLVPTTYPLTAFDRGVYPITAVVVGGGGSFTVAGDHTAAFPVSGGFSVTGSTGNDGAYTVDSASFAAGDTTVVVINDVIDATPDGSLVVARQTITVAGNQTAAFAPGVPINVSGNLGIEPAVVVSSVYATETTVVLAPGSLGPFNVYDSAIVAVGATAYTPAVGDMLLGTTQAPLTLVSVSEAWNGTTPTLKVLTESYRQLQTQFVSLDATSADIPAGPSLALSAFPGFSVGTEWRLLRFTTVDPILVQVDNNNGLDPGSTQGAAEIVLMLIPAA